MHILVCVCTAAAPYKHTGRALQRDRFLPANNRPSVRPSHNTRRFKKLIVIGQNIMANNVKKRIWLKTNKPYCTVFWLSAIIITIIRVSRAHVRRWQPAGRDFETIADIIAKHAKSRSRVRLVYNGNNNKSLRKYYLIRPASDYSSNYCTSIRTRVICRPPPPPGVVHKRECMESITLNGIVPSMLSLLLPC